MAKAQHAHEEAVILEWFHDNLHADVLNREFCEFYTERVQTEEIVQAFGANKVKGLGAALSRLYRRGALQRGVAGLVNAERGFPKWAYVYELPNHNEKGRLPKEPASVFRSCCQDQITTSDRG